MQKEITSPLSVPCLVAQRSIPVGLSVCLSNFTCLQFAYCLYVSLFLSIFLYGFLSRLGECKRLPVCLSV